MQPENPSDGAWKDMGTGQLSIKCREGASKATKESKPTVVVRNDVRLPSWLPFHTKMINFISRSYIYIWLVTRKGVIAKSPYDIAYSNRGRGKSSSIIVETLIHLRAYKKSPMHM